MQVERFEHAGVRYGVRSWGAGGAPVVLVHGFAQSAASWDEVAPLLARDRAVCALDLAGHGASDRPVDPAPYALDAQAEALLAFLAGFERRPAVVGYSMGGRVALAAAVKNPHAFAALILEGAGLGPATADEREAARERDLANAARLRAEGVLAFMDAWERLPLFATQRDLPAATREGVRAGRLANDVESLARTFEHAGQHAMPDRAVVLAALAQLRDGGVPVLYLAGERDAKYRALAEGLATAGLAETRIIEGAGHNVHLEAPDAFAREVSAFLSAR
ncbi:alpha/beta fold hydrolase [Arabiibacter massiliensis]|uniref:alpha/beta fold hydrolase n=1 Tax=Arabiibacter massiliensis TaxID=1870985 RepID=UPI0009BB437D|nr:alpha/beta fold hydrolase [Arabiibacter massiliensis]